MSVAFFNADRLSNVNNESRAEENIYFPPHFRTVASRTTNQISQQNQSGDVTSVNNHRIQERDMVKIIDEKVEKLKKITVSLVIAGSVMSVVLVLVASLTFFALYGQKQQSLVVEQVTKDVVPIQGDLTVLKNWLDSFTEQVNTSMQLVNNGLNYYSQRIMRLEDRINQNRATVDQINNNLANEPRKFTLIFMCLDALLWFPTINIMSNIRFILFCIITVLIHPDLWGRW